MKLKAKSRLQAALLNEQEKAPKIVRSLQKKRAKAKGQKDTDLEEAEAIEDVDLEETGEWEDEEDSDADPAEQLLDVDAEEGESDDEDDDEDAQEGGLKLGLDDEESSESEVEMEERLPRAKRGKVEQQQKVEDEEDEEEDEEEEGIDLEDIEGELDSEEDADIVPWVKNTINNHAALDAAVARISFVKPNTAFVVHQTLLSSTVTEESADFDVQDDLKRELAFHAQSLEAATKARSLLMKDKVSFTRPNDYFAEMLRSNEIMDKVKTKLIEQATSKKASAEARKLRDLKKFGKQVQIAKQQERAKEKKESLEKIQSLKRKRQEGGSSSLKANEADDLFDVALENELGDQRGAKKGRDGKRSAGRGAGGEREPNAKRQKKDAKFGFGGKKRYAKSGDATSSGDLSSFSSRRMRSGPGGPGGAGGAKKGGAPRPGKSRRAAAARR